MLNKIPDFTQARILVVGDIMLDRYLFGSTSRISPEAPVPIVHVDQTEERAGGAGNVALNIAELGANTTLVGLIGDDDEGKRLTDILSKHQVKCELLSLNNHRTISKLRVVSKNQQLIRLDFESKVAFEKIGRVEEKVEKLIDQHDVVILSDYGKGVLLEIEKLISICKKHNKPVLVDPKGSDFSRYANATLITPNMNEFETVAGICDSDEELESQAMQLLERFNLDALLVTRSEKGMCLFQAGKQTYRLATNAKEVYDVTGAGDTVISSLGAALAVGLDLSAASQLANLAAGLVVAKLGTASVSHLELVEALHGQSDVSRKIVNKQALSDKVSIARHQGERIIMTNGCFDILHAGHIKYLREAKQLGSKLIVAVNSDQSVRRLKGKTRPLNTLVDRMELLAALEYVDWVVPFEADTPEELIHMVTPDVLVKGGDYKAADIVGYQWVTEKGGEVIVLKYHDGLSTTNIIEKAKR